MVRRFLFLTVLLGFAAPNASFAYSDYERNCFANIMEQAIAGNKVIVASTVLKTCACQANMAKQGLSRNVCPWYRWTSFKEYSKYFSKPD